jgi:hypothetical protein
MWRTGQLRARYEVECDDELILLLVLGGAGAVFVCYSGVVWW